MQPKKRKCKTGAPPNNGKMPTLYNMVDLLPKEMKPYGEQCIGILIMSVLTMLCIFLVGTLVANLTGHADLIGNVFATEITGIGILTVGAIFLQFKKTV